MICSSASPLAMTHAIYSSAPPSPRYRLAIARWSAWLPGPDIAAGPDAVTYLYGPPSSCAHTLSQPAARTDRVFRDSPPLITITPPPGWDPYHIDTLTGAP